MGFKNLVKKVIQGGNGDRDISYPDSFDISEQLAGTLGPVFTQDSIDLDEATDQTVTIQDSFDTDDILRAKTFNGTADNFPDSVDIGDLATPVLIVANQPDSLDLSQLLFVGQLTLPDSLDADDLRGTANLANATIYPNVVVSNTGFTTPANWADNNPATVITLAAAQSGGLGGGNSVTTNGDLIVSVGDVIFVPTQTVDSAQIEWTWTTSATALLQNGNAVNVQLQYSLNEGVDWITFDTANAPGATNTSTLPITLNPTQLNQLRFRALGSVTSGTIALVGGAAQNFTSGYVRLLFNATQVFP